MRLVSRRFGVILNEHFAEEPCHVFKHMRLSANGEIELDKKGLNLNDLIAAMLGVGDFAEAQKVKLNYARLPTPQIPRYLRSMITNFLRL